MTNAEFKAWFDGFCEAIDKQPTQKQWARIKARVAEIDGNPVTERIYVDRYWPTVRPYISQPWWENTYTPTWCSASAVTGGQVSYNASDAMADLGRADYASLS